MTTRTARRIVYSITIGCLLFLLLPLAIGPFTSGLSDICSRVEEINIKTGQVRTSRYYWFIAISRHTESTTLSEALQGKTIDVSNIEPWHRVTSFPLGGSRSPHYAFHGALGQDKRFHLLCRMGNLPPARKHHIAAEILALWQTSGNDSEAGAYIDRLEQDVPTATP